LPAIHRDLVLSNPSVDFLVVYIEEAHAQDEWPISSSRYAEKPVLINQPTTVEERIAVCKIFLSSYNVPESGPNFQVIVDDPSTNNAFSAAYAPWPFRLFRYPLQKSSRSSPPLMTASTT
ncbi:hypothetical protein TrST_g3682, partial [Triparma strigata]